MTNSEAIRIINQYDCNFYWTDGEKIPTEDLIEAFYLAVKALEAQEPRVLTLEEVESSDNSVWLEKEILGWEPISVLVDKVGKYLDTFIASGGLSFQGEKSNGHGYGDYGETWRCWTSCPTDEQRKAVKWDDTGKTSGRKVKPND